MNEKRERIIEILRDHKVDEGIIRDAEQGYYDHYDDDVNHSPNRLEVLLNKMGKPRIRFRDSSPQGGNIR